MDQTDNTILHRAVLVAAQTLRRMGFTVDVLAMDWSTLIQRRASKAPPAQGGWNVFVTNATLTGIGNPLLHNFVKNCEQAWYGWPCDQRIVDLTRQWALETDTAKRKADHRSIAAARTRQRHLHPARPVPQHYRLSQGTHGSHPGACRSSIGTSEESASPPGACR